MSDHYDVIWAEIHENPIDVGLETDDALMAYFAELRLATALWDSRVKPTTDAYFRAMVAYHEFRRELGRDLMAQAWRSAKAGVPELAPLMAYNAGYRLHYRGSAAQKKHQAKYGQKVEVKARRAELAKARRATAKAHRAELLQKWRDEACV